MVARASGPYGASVTLSRLILQHPLGRPSHAVLADRRAGRRGPAAWRRGHAVPAVARPEVRQAPAQRPRTTSRTRRTSRSSPRTPARTPTRSGGRTSRRRRTPRSSWGRTASRSGRGRATPEETERLWPRFDAGHKGYAEYRARAYRRTIPVVILEPRDARSLGGGCVQADGGNRTDLRASATIGRADPTDFGP